MHLKMPSVEWRSFCLDLNVYVNNNIFIQYIMFYLYCWGKFDDIKVIYIYYVIEESVHMCQTKKNR